MDTSTILPTQSEDFLEFLLQRPSQERCNGLATRILDKGAATSSSLYRSVAPSRPYDTGLAVQSDGVRSFGAYYGMMVHDDRNKRTEARGMSYRSWEQTLIFKDTLENCLFRLGPTVRSRIVISTPFHSRVENKVPLCGQPYLGETRLNAVFSDVPDVPRSAVLEYGSHIIRP